MFECAGVLRVRQNLNLQVLDSLTQQQEFDEMGLSISDITISHRVSRLSQPVYISRSARRNNDV
jgi:hypothetical protein